MVSDNKVVLLCGPKGCGKTEAVKMISQQSCVVPLNFKDHLHQLTMRFFLVDEDEYWHIYNTRELKESPLDEFRVEEGAYEELCEYLGTETDYSGRRHEGFKCNLSIREAMIYVSEIVCKVAFDGKYFGRAFVYEMQKGESGQVYIDDSCGFESEVVPIINEVGQDNILLIRIHGRGDFSNDSRNYIPDGVVDNTVDVWNNGTEQQYLDNMYTIVNQFIGEK